MKRKQKQRRRSQYAGDIFLLRIESKMRGAARNTFEPPH
jgi:hypothetical protein